MAPPLTVAAPPDSPSMYEQQNVHDVYNQIATHFSATRYKPWPTIQQFLLSIPPGSLGLDAGCGNGKYLPSWDSPLSSGAIMVGLDRSENLAALARRVGFAEGDSAGGGGDGVPLVVHDLAAGGEEGRKDDGRRREVMVGDVLDLGGVREGSMDFAISIATLHHLSTPSRRLTTVRTFLRILSPTHGRAMIHVWALEQGEGARRVVPEGGKAQDVFVPWVLSKEAPKTVGEALKGKKEKKVRVRKEQKKGEGRREGRDAREMSVDPTPAPSTEDSTSTAPSEPTPSPAPPPPPPGVEEEEPPRVYQRYYHLFKAGELQDLIASACEEEGFSFLPFSEPDSEQEHPTGVEGKWVRIVKQGWDRDNWFCEVRRGEGVASASA